MYDLIEQNPMQKHGAKKIYPSHCQHFLQKDQFTILVMLNLTNINLCPPNCNVMVISPGLILQLVWQYSFIFVDVALDLMK